jgi:hypothetical protein
MELLVKRTLAMLTFLIVTAAVYAVPMPIKRMDTIVTNNTVISAKAILNEKLVSFHATYDRNAVSLHWNINAVNYSNHFDIERSVDGTNYEKIGEARQYDAAPNEYFFEDNFKPSFARNNDIFYRLKQSDAERNAVYSKALIVRSFKSKSVEAISVTPDPSVNDIEVNVQLKQPSFVVMKVTNAAGNEIMRKSERGDDGNNKYALTGTSKLRPGDYTLEIIVNSNERMTLHLIKS